MPRLRRELIGQPALADAGLAGDQEQPPTTLERLVYPRQEFSELALPSDEDAAGAALLQGRLPRPFLHVGHCPALRDVAPCARRAFAEDV